MQKKYTTNSKHAGFLHVKRALFHTQTNWILFMSEEKKVSVVRFIELRLWDCLRQGRPLAKISKHNYIVTFSRYGKLHVSLCHAMAVSVLLCSLQCSCWQTVPSNAHTSKICRYLLHPLCHMLESCGKAFSMITSFCVVDVFVSAMIRARLFDGINCIV